MHTRHFDVMDAPLQLRDDGKHLPRNILREKHWLDEDGRAPSTYGDPYVDSCSIWRYTGATSRAYLCKSLRVHPCAHEKDGACTFPGQIKTEKSSVLTATGRHKNGLVHSLVAQYGQDEDTLTHFRAILGHGAVPNVNLEHLHTTDMWDNTTFVQLSRELFSRLRIGLTAAESLEGEKLYFVSGATLWQSNTFEDHKTVAHKQDKPYHDALYPCNFWKA